MRRERAKCSLERLNPVLMRAHSAGLALIPLALASGEPENETQSPMAVVVLGGLLTAVVLNMLVVPALFLRYGVDRPAPPGPRRRAGSRSRCWMAWAEAGPAP